MLSQNSFNYIALCPEKKEMLLYKAHLGKTLNTQRWFLIEHYKEKIPYLR